MTGAKIGHDPVAATGCETGPVATEQQRGRGGGPWAPPSAGAAPPAPGTRVADGPDPDADDPSFGDRVRDLLDRLGVRDVDVPFDSVSDGVRWWFQPLGDVRVWKSIGALFVGAIIAPLFFGLSVAVSAVTAVLSLLVIGLLLVPAAFAVIAAFASVGRRLAGWTIDEPIEPRPVATGGDGVLGPVTTRLGDETRWRHVAFLALDLAVAPLFLAGVLLPVTVVVGLVGIGDLTSPFGWFDFGLSATVGLIQLLLAIVMLGAVARLALLAGTWRHRYVSMLLGPDRESALVERVEELSVQRDQVVDAVAAERRRIERNLHDGVQQQLVALGIDIGRASNKLEDDPDAARALLDEARDKVRSSIGELRLIGRGLHPAVLGDRGLDAALSSVVANAPIPISVTVHPMADGSTDLPPDVAETAYYIASESVANVLKYADARVASIHVEPDPGLLPAVRVTVHDDGRGGANAAKGSGIAGMRARVEAVDGAFRLDSPEGGPTVVTAVIPLRRTRPGDGQPPNPGDRGV